MRAACTYVDLNIFRKYYSMTFLKLLNKKIFLDSKNNYNVHDGGRLSCHVCYPVDRYVFYINFISILHSDDSPNKMF